MVINFSESRFKTKTMFGCHHLNPNLKLKPCLVVVICNHQIFAYTRFSSIGGIGTVISTDSVDNIDRKDSIDSIDRIDIIYSIDSVKNKD